MTGLGRGRAWRAAAWPVVPLAAALVAGPAGPARAGYDGYEGGCRLVDLVTDDPGPDETLRYRGAMWILVVPTSGGAPMPSAQVEVECHYYVDGDFQGVLAAASGVGLAATATTFDLTHPASDVISFCEVVTVDGDRRETCFDYHPTTLPWVVREQVDPILEEVFP